MILVYGDLFITPHCVSVLEYQIYQTYYFRHKTCVQEMVKEGIAFHSKLPTRLRATERHPRMGYSVNAPNLNPSQPDGTRFTYPGGIDG